jgi:hypothetical protein
MIRAHQPGSEPLDIPEAIPNPAVPRPVPAPSQTPKEPVKAPAPQNAYSARPLIRDALKANRGHCHVKE